MLQSKERSSYLSEEKQVHLFVLAANWHKLRLSNFNYHLKVFALKKSLSHLTVT